MYAYGFKYTHIHDHTCWYKYFMKERGMGTLLIRVRYRCREMVIWGTWHDIIEGNEV